MNEERAKAFDWLYQSLDTKTRQLNIYSVVKVGKERKETQTKRNALRMEEKISIRKQDIKRSKKSYLIKDTSFH